LYDLYEMLGLRIRLYEMLGLRIRLYVKNKVLNFDCLALESITFDIHSYVGESYNLNVIHHIS